MGAGRSESGAGQIRVVGVKLKVDQEGQVRPYTGYAFLVMDSPKTICGFYLEICGIGGSTSRMGRICGSIWEMSVKQTGDLWE